MLTIIRKELADNFTGIRIIILFVLAILVSVYGLRSAYSGMRGIEAPDGFVFLGLFTAPGIIFQLSMVDLLAVFVIPLTGILLGFDAINSERTRGTMSRLMAQPIYRDNVINAKFIAGMFTIVIMMGTIVLLVSGFGLRMIGLPPTGEEVSRLVFYFIFSIIYAGFWMALSMLFSITFKGVPGSILTSICLWLFFSVFILFIAPLIADSVAPISAQPTFIEAARNAELYQTISRFSPTGLFSQTTGFLLLPYNEANVYQIFAGPAGNYWYGTPLPLSQSLLQIWPQLTSIVGVTAVVFGLSYVLFMRQEIRST